MRRRLELQRARRGARRPEAGISRGRRAAQGAAAGADRAGAAALQGPRRRAPPSAGTRFSLSGRGGGAGGPGAPPRGRARARAAAPVHRSWRSGGGSSSWVEFRLQYIRLVAAPPAPAPFGPCHEEKEAVRELQPLPCSATLAAGHGDGGGAGAHAASIHALFQVISIGRFGHYESQKTPGCGSDGRATSRCGRRLFL